MNNQPIAYLCAYLPDDSYMEYRTTSYEEVVRFKKVCKETGITFAVRFKKAPVEESYVVKNKGTQLAKNIGRVLYDFFIK